MSDLTYADFFAGIGLARLGLDAAGWRMDFANDIDTRKFEMYEENFDNADEAYVVKGIKEVQAAEVPAVDLWWASFPCTDVSLAGNREGLRGKQSGSIMRFLDLLRDKDGQRPPLVALENVIGFVTSNKGRDFARTIRRLNKLGYTCDSFVVDAARFVPQSRPRLFIIGWFDSPTTRDLEGELAKRQDAFKNSQLTNFMLGKENLGWAVHQLPDLPERASRLPAFLQRLSPKSYRWWDAERVAYLLDQMSEKHVSIVEELREGPNEKWATAFRRMRNGKSMAEVRADGVAGCLRTPRGGSSRQILLAAGKGVVRVRYMTPIEYARLMGAPRYRTRVSDTQAYFGFGDAVCVPVISWVADNVLTPLAKVQNGLADGSFKAHSEDKTKSPTKGPAARATAYG